MSPYVHPLLLHFESYLHQQRFHNTPAELYEPVNYILHLGGKRIRPLLLLLSCEAYCGEYHHALPAAFAVELFHNFTLIHDDILDNAHLRRGRETVHKKYNLPAAILSGDVMMIWCYKYLQKTPSEKFSAVFHVFNEMAISVCEGQQLDMNFEKKKYISEAEYFAMIQNKTAVLLAACLKIGAILGHAADEEANKMYQLGIALGTAFQLQDDWLDAFGDSRITGKEKGGDIKNNKKTLLLIKAADFANDTQRQLLHQALHPAAADKLSTILQLIEDTGARKYVEEKVQSYHTMAFSLLDSLAIPHQKKTEIKQLLENLLHRSS